MAVAGFDEHAEEWQSWLIATVLKTVEGVSLPGVRIPLPPP